MEKYKSVKNPKHFLNPLDVSDFDLNDFFFPKQFKIMAENLSDHHYAEAIKGYRILNKMVLIPFYIFLASLIAACLV